MKMKNYLATAMLFCAALINSSHAQVQNWQAGPAESDFGDFTNWTFQVPNKNTIAAVGPHPNAENSEVLLDQNRTIGAILVTDGMFLRNNGHRLTVNNLNAGGLSVAGSNTPGGLLRRSKLILNGVGGGLALDMNGSLRVTSGGQIELNNSPVAIEDDLVIGAYGNLIGFGTSSITMDHGDFGGVVQATAGAELLLDSQSYDFDGPNNQSLYDLSAAEARIRLEHSEILAI